jgi:hypothetical protein
MRGRLQGWKWKEILLSLLLLQSGALGGQGVATPPGLTLPSSQAGSAPAEEVKKAEPEYRTFRKSIYERINPRPFIGQGGLDWPYAVVSRQDVAIVNLLNPNCPSFNPNIYRQLVEQKGFEEYRLWPEKKPDGSLPTEEEKKRAIERKVEELRRDPTCPKGQWYLPLSSLYATQEVAGQLKRAWERFEDRYFWRVVTEVNNPVYWFAYCVLGLGVESYSKGPRPAVDFTPSEILPPELGTLLSNDILNLVSSYRRNLGGEGSSWEETPNYRAESAGKLRKPVYLPFVPTVPPREFCDNLGFRLPIFYIPAFVLQVMGVEIWRSPGYPDQPFIFDQDEADRRIRDAISHALGSYYPEYLAKDVLKALFIPPGKSSDPNARVENAVEFNLRDLENLGAQGRPSCSSRTDAVSFVDCLSRPLQNVEGLLYFPVPWQAPILGGGAVVTPVFAYPYPDPLRTAIDMMVIYDMVGKLLGADHLSLIEKGALALYYLQPLLNYLDMPLLPGVIDIPVRDTPAGQAIVALYGVVRSVVETAVDSFLKGIDRAGQAAFGAERGQIYAAGVRLILAPFTELLASNDPKWFVGKALVLLRQIDEFVRTFTGQGANFRNVINGVPVAPGLWRFEELKRAFPVTNPILQRLFGYSSFFAAWSQFDVTLIPDLTADWANPGEFALAAISRLVGFWHVPLRINIVFYPPWVVVTPDIPRYMLLPPYFLPFAGERIYWGWFNVPEGYPIPLVKGKPGDPLPSLGGDHPLRGFDGRTGLARLYEYFLFRK